MIRNVIAIALLAALTGTAAAGTFVPRDYLADNGVESLTRDVTNRMLGRDLFHSPYATVVVGNVDVYEGFPYLESRHFQIVSDPGWNRLLLGESGQGLQAFDGKASSVGALREPRGLAVDDQGRVYVADTGNNRVVVFKLVSEFDEAHLVPEQVIDGLNGPWDVAVSDAGTPFVPEDDRLYVANSGRNEVRRYVAGSEGWRHDGSVGELGSGAGHFAGPLAVTVGRAAGSNSDAVYVSDAHNGRLVELADDGGGLRWVRAWQHELGVVTSLTADHWGNVYAAAPQSGGVVKCSKSLAPLASLGGDVERPRSFHIPFVTVRDHRTGAVSRVGEGSGILVEQWSGDSGIRLLNLGVDVQGVAVSQADEVEVSLTLTDNAMVSVEILDPVSGELVARHDAGHLEPGVRTLRFTEADHLAAWDAGSYQVTVKAASTYEHGSGGEVSLQADLGGVEGLRLPGRVQLYANHPNPFNPSTTIRFSVPAGAARQHTLRVYDARGRMVRELARGSVGQGEHAAVWDGRDASGATMGSGMYLYRLQVGDVERTGKMVLLK